MKVYKAEQIRNVALISHGGSGKTSLVDVALYDTGAVTRIGKVDEGSSISDYDPDEIKRRMSINLTVVPIEWHDTKINLLDTPGYADFVGEVKAGLRVADAAVVLVTAEKGVEVGTELVWRYADELKLPRIVFVNKLDRENTSFARALESLQTQFGNKVVPLYLPIGEQAGFKGVVNLVTRKAYTFDGTKVQEGPVPGDLEEQVTRYREQLIESAVESDDDLMNKYLEGEELSLEEVERAVKAGTSSGGLVPVLCGSVAKNIGIQTLLDAITEFLPSAADAQKKIAGETNGNIAAFVYKTTADATRGLITFFRVYSGTLKSDSHAWNLRTNTDERIGQILLMRGKMQENATEVPAGDIGAVVKLQNTHTNDTLSAKEKPLTLSPIDFPPPAFTAAIAPKTKSDLDKMGTALSRVTEEDPTIHITRDQETAETLISGMGESHIDITIERMQRKFGVDVEKHDQRVPYRETIRKHARAQGRHKRQSGGHGQFGDVWLEIDPIPMGSEKEFEFENKIVGGVVPKEYVPGVEKGVREALKQGFVAGYPMIYIKVALVDGSYHPVDSSSQAFEVAGSLGMKNAVPLAGPTLLEPIMNVTVMVPEGNMGDVMSDLTTKRARIGGMEPTGSGMQQITATVPMAEMLHYATDLRSITQGRGTFHMEFFQYEEVPAAQQQQIIANAKKAAEDAGGA
jgi:elongation factor G